ncbi:MAG TPA: TonB-dependent receptor [Steroidobacteraceae bacterium]|nr:TonB-dependent receptor [Steroidobacteraceae bacterium]
MARIGLYVGTAWLPLCRAAALTDMSLEELGRIPVTSVSRTAEPLSDAPAAIYVITGDAIRRSGVTTLADALRLAPNLLVTQLGSSNYSVAARGFGGRPDTQSFSNKLLLLIDGRSVYSPLYSGIYLDTQDVPLADVDRIEVISGPGATLWGANAMNGVINVITRPAYLTQGPEVWTAAGNDERQITARYGDDAGRDISYRVYGKAFRRDAMNLENGTSAGDGWHRGQAGFRLDLVRGDGTATLQGDAYTGADDRVGPGTEAVGGANLLARWEKQTGSSSWHVQGYFDHVERAAPADGTAFVLNTWDAEIQQSLAWGPRQQLVWGGGARLHRYQIDDTATLLFEPPQRALQIWNLFAQDTLALATTLKLTVGLKLEHDSLGGWEPQPDARLAWNAGSSSLLWAAASRAVRAPTPFDTDVVERAGGADFLVGKPDFHSEDVLTYELGYRGAISTALSLSASVFYNRYDNLRTVELSAPPTYLPLHWDNLMAGHTYGLSAWATWQIADWWRLSPGVRLLHKHLYQKTGASGLLDTGQDDDDPRLHALVDSAFELGRGATLDLSVQRVSSLPEPALPARTELAARLAWRFADSWELSLRDTNVLHRRQLEYPAPAGVPIRSSVLAEVRWNP